MNAQELRIGNLICTGKKEGGTDEIGIVVRLESLTYKEWNTPGENHLVFLPLDARHKTDFWETDEHCPIALTKKWLLRFGFDEEKWAIDIFTNGRLRIWKGGRGDFLAYLVEQDTTTGHFIPNHGLRYVHQLQNLYFALTGEELVLKPEKEAA